MSKQKERVIPINSPKGKYRDIWRYWELSGKWSFKLIRGKALPSTCTPKSMLWLHHATVMDGQSSAIYLLAWNERIQAEPTEHCSWKCYPIHSQGRRETLRGQKGHVRWVCAHRAEYMSPLPTPHIFAGWGVGSRHVRQNSSVFPVAWPPPH